MVRLAATPDLAPGENARGQVTGAAWSFVLADRNLGTILSLGFESAPTVATLRRICPELIVARPEGRGFRRLLGMTSGGRPNLREVIPSAASRWPLADGSISLIVIVDPWWYERLARDPGLEADLERVLTADGSVFAYLPRPATSERGTRGSSSLPVGFDPMDSLWLGQAGEMRAVVPAVDRPLIDFVKARWDQNGDARSRLKGLVRRLKGRTVTQQLGGLRQRGELERLACPPRYIRQAAAAAGRSIDDHRWALIDPGAYSTKKLLLFLFRPRETEPEYVVKLVRDARFNARLENAWRALVDLNRRLPTSLRTLPRPVFFGQHAGLALLAESVVDGTPLRQRMTGEPDDPLVHAVVDWLLGLGLATADASVASPADVAGELRGMLQHFSDTYRPGRKQRDFLDTQVATVADHSAPFPLVFQHGDAGAWNVLVGADGRPALLDWEASVPHGMPLWDLFYFLRSVAVSVSRSHGVRDPLTAFERHYFQASPLGRLLVETVDRFCASSGLARSLVEPLFYTCWMHRALRESSTLPPARLARGRYVTLLARCIEQRNAPGLRLLFADVPSRHA